MVLLREFIELITVPPGDLVYHLVTLFAIQLILGMAFGHWHRHRRDPAAIRLLVVGVGFALTRVLLMFIAGLDRVGALSSGMVLPPLERFLDLATLLLAAWALLPVPQRYVRLSVMVLVLALLVAAGAYGVFAVRWLRIGARGVAYNDYWQGMAWEFSAILALVLALAASVIWRSQDWGLVVCLLLVWLTGHALQFAAPLTGSHTAGWVRLANLAALPIMAGLVYGRVLEASPARAEDAALGVVQALNSLHRIRSPRDVEAALKSVAAPIARALGADMVAVGLPAPGPAKGIRVVALHRPSGAMQARQGPILLVSRHPLLATALQTGRLQHVRVLRKDVATAAFYRSLGFERPGPLLMNALVDGGAPLGIMLAGNPISQRDWTAQDERLFQTVVAAMAASLANASRGKSIGPSAELQKAFSEARRLADQVAELEAEGEHQRQRAEELATKLRLREWEAANQSQTMVETAVWQEEMRALTEARSTLEADLAQWTEKARQLASSNDDLQARLLQAQAELEEARTQASPAQNEIPVSLIHELRTPMTSIIGYVDVLLGESVGILGEMQRQFLQRVRANVERMGGLLNDLIRVAAIDAGEIVLSPEPVDLINVIEDAIMALSAQFGERKLAVQMDMPSELPPVCADRDSLYQIVLHLLSNACQCSQSGTQILVSARLEKYDDQVEGLPDHLFMSVTDTGGGITPEDQRRVFQRLYRADNPLIAGLGDTGVGLSIAKSLVETQGGRIWVESQMGVGSAFSFIIPLSSREDQGSRPSGGGSAEVKGQQ